MFLDYYNYFSIGVISTGLGLYIFRWVRSYRSKKCYCFFPRKKTVVITGATSGLGKHCAYELSKRNCKLILGCRNLVAGQKIVNDINQSSNSTASLIFLDLSDLQSIKDFTNRLFKESVDVLINNAGVMTGHFRMVPSTQTEQDMSVNYLGHFYLTNLLLPNLYQNSLPPRIIFISSSLCKQGELDVENLDFTRYPYSPMQAYANSKLALCIFARSLDQRLNRDGGDRIPIDVVTMFTGGMVHTGLSRHILASYNVFFQPILRFLSTLLLRDARDVCHSIVHWAISDKTRPISGGLYSGFEKIDWPDRVDKSMELCDALWARSSTIVGLIERPVEI